MFARLILLFSQTYLTSSSSPSSMSTCSPNPLTPPSLTDCRLRPTPVALQSPSEGETRSQMEIVRLNLNFAFLLKTFSSSGQVSLKLNAAQDLVLRPFNRLWSAIPLLLQNKRWRWWWRTQQPTSGKWKPFAKRSSSRNTWLVLAPACQEYVHLVKNGDLRSVIVSVQGTETAPLAGLEVGTGIQKAVNAGVLVPYCPAPRLTRTTI